MDVKSSSDSEKTNGNNNKSTPEISEEECGQVINFSDSNGHHLNVDNRTDVQEPVSQSIFSQETPEIDVINEQINLTSGSTVKSSDLIHVTQPMELVILETESDSATDKGSVIAISDSTESLKHEHQKSVRRKSSEMSPVPYKKSCLEEIKESQSSTNIDTPSNTREEPPRSNTPVQSVPVRSSPRNSPIKNKNDHRLLQPARRLKKSASVDNNFSIDPKSSPIKSATERKTSKLTLRRKRATSVDIKHSTENISMEVQSQDELAQYLDTENKFSLRTDVDIIMSSGRKNPIQPIAEETQRDISNPGVIDANVSDSQTIQLFLSESYDNQELLSNEVMENEPLLSQDLNDNPDTSNKVVLLSGNEDILSMSNGDVHKISSQESTTSLDSPYNLEIPENPIIKSKQYLSNGYSSSTPENAPENVFSPSAQFPNFNIKPDSKSNSISTINSSISPLNNGHSNGSHNMANSSHPTTPTFHIQMCGDENDDFLSMFIVKTTNELGAQTLREYQRLSKRLSIDSYAGDVSKNTSPSSVTSGGPLQLPPHPRSSFMSTTSSSSTSSSRTSDGAFIIPQRPKRNLSFHTPASVKGWSALKQTLTDIISKLADIDPMEEPVRSPVNGDYKVEQTPCIDTSDNLATNDKQEKSTVGDYHRTTPKSSKKKVQTRMKRIISSKIKKTELSSTNEESEVIENISSPEIIPTDRCEQFQTPLRIKSNDEMINGSKSTPKGKKIKNSAALNLSTPKDALMVHQEFQGFPPGTLVLAKWRDKKYYCGKVKGVTDSNKYEIEFYDGQVKTLLEDFIIFGNMSELPLKGQSVYTKVEDDAYEPSLVLAVEKNETGEVVYKCTTDRNSIVAVTASDIYMTEDQAKSFNEANLPKSPHSAPGTPRRRINRDLDLNNIIYEPRSARLRDKGTPRGALSAPASPKAGPSSVRRGGGLPQRRLESESSEGGDSRASSAAPEDVDGVQPETQITPRKTKGFRVNYVAKTIAIKGSSKLKTGKESKIKFKTEEEIAETLGPIPSESSTVFNGLCFLLTCTDVPVSRERSCQTYSDSDSCVDSSGKEDELLLAKIPFIKKRLEEQLQRGGGTVFSRFEDIPKSKYNSCRLIVPRSCLTGKFIMCLAANIKALCHLWVIQSCKSQKLADYDSYAISPGYSIERERLISLEERISSKPFKDKLILICSENNNFAKFWDRVCSLNGANTKIIADDMDLRNSIAIVTESNCPTKVVNKAEYEKVPLVSTTWIVQCLIEGKLLSFTSNIRYRFDYIDE